MFGLAGGPRRPTVPTLGLNVVAPAGLLVARRHSADVALKAIGIVEPGCAWMLVSWVGSVRLMFTNALALPVICHSPAPAWLGATVDATPFGTEPKFSPESVDRHPDGHDDRVRRDGRGVLCGRRGRGGDAETKGEDREPPHHGIRTRTESRTTGAGSTTDGSRSSRSVSTMSF